MDHGVFGAIVQKEIYLKHWGFVGIHKNIIDPMTFIIAVGNNGNCTWYSCIN